MLNVNQVVRVGAQIAPTGLLRREFGRTLFVTTGTSIPSNERVREYASMEDVAADWPVLSEVYQAANIYFQQSPYPKNFLVGRWFNAVGTAKLIGGSPVAALASFAEITAGSMAIKISLTPDYATDATDTIVLTGLDFHACLSLADVAEVVELTLLAAIDGLGFDVATFTYDPTSGFVLEITADDPETIVTTGYAYAHTVGTDISAMLMLDAANAAFKESSVVEEAIEDALSGIELFNGSFYFITSENTSINDTATAEAISAWVASRVYMYSADSSDLASLTGNDSVFNRLSLLAPPRTFGTWSRTADYKGVSAAGRLSSINFNASNSLITLKFKDLPGTLADVVMTPTQAAALANQAINFYSERSGVKMYEEGYTFDTNVWIDVRFWLDWFVNASQVEAFNVLKAIPTRVPQTEEGMTALKNAVESICIQGKKNGGIAGGQLSPALTLDVQQSTGNASFDGYLADGYFVYADTIASMAQSDRAQRKAPPIKVWLKGSGAIHFIDISIVFEN